MSNFNELQTTQYGDLGENFINEFATAMGCKAYQPSIKQSNPVDSINACKSKKTGKWTLASIEVKTKARMLYFETTGYDKVDHETYMDFPAPVCIVFVDWLEGAIYYQWVSKLDKHKIEMDKTPNLVHFPLSAMEIYRKLTSKETKELKQFANSNYN